MSSSRSILYHSFQCMPKHFPLRCSSQKPLSLIFLLKQHYIYKIALGYTPLCKLKYRESSSLLFQIYFTVISFCYFCLVISLKSVPLTSMFLIQAYIISHLDCSSFLTGLAALVLNSSIPSTSSTLHDRDLSDHLSHTCMPVHIHNWNPSLLSNHPGSQIVMFLPII